MSKSTKTVKLTDAFRNAAIADPLGALATAFYNAFGVDLGTLIRIYKQAVEAEDAHVLTMAITAGVQIRGNVVFVGRDFGKIRENYPELVIEGDRPQQDIYNFGALHALGHLVFHMEDGAVSRRALAKAGSCITGDDTSDTEAGKINKEISESWTRADRALFKDLQTSQFGEAFVTELMEGLAGKRDAFIKRMAPPKASPGRASSVATAGAATGASSAAAGTAAGTAATKKPAAGTTTAVAPGPKE